MCGQEPDGVVEAEGETLCEPQVCGQVAALQEGKIDILKRAGDPTLRAEDTEHGEEQGQPKGDF